MCILVPPASGPTTAFKIRIILSAKGSWDEDSEAEEENERENGEQEAEVEEEARIHIETEGEKKAAEERDRFDKLYCFMAFLSKSLAERASISKINKFCEPEANERKKRRKLKREE